MRKSEESQSSFMSVSGAKSPRSTLSYFSSGNYSAKSNDSNQSFRRSFSYADCTDEELQSLLTKFNQELIKINLENEILEKFLTRIQPHTLTGMNLYLDSAQVVAQRVQTMQTMQPTLGNKLPSSPSISIPRGTETMSIVSNPTRSTLRHTGAAIPKLTVAFRMELVVHEMEELRTSLEQCQAECRVAKFKLKSQIEEKNIAISEILLAKTSLEQNVTGERTDDTIQKVPAERYFRYFNDLLKNFDQKLGKMKMKITSMRIQLTRLKGQLEQKIELGEMIHPVDFDELRIENKDFVKNLEEKNKYLLGLKRVTGRCNQNLNSKKRYLEELSDKLQTLLEEIQIKERITKRLEAEELKTQDEINVAQVEYAQIKDTVSNYSAPSIVSYAEKKTELQELEKSIRIWRRRVNLQDTTMTLLKRKLKQIKNHEIQDSWFQGSGGSLEDDNFSEMTSVAEQM